MFHKQTNDNHLLLTRKKCHYVVIILQTLCTVMILYIYIIYKTEQRNGGKKITHLPQQAKRIFLSKSIVWNDDCFPRNVTRIQITTLNASGNILWDSVNCVTLGATWASSGESSSFWPILQNGETPGSTSDSRQMLTHHKARSLLEVSSLRQLLQT